MPEGERAFEVDEVAERQQQCVQRRPVQPGGAVGCVLQRRGPHVSRRRHRQHPCRVGDECVDHRGIELPAPPAARHRHRALDAVLALMHLDHVGQLGDAHLDRDRLARRPGRQAAAVEAFEREPQRGLHIRRQPDPFGQQRGRRAVGVDELRNMASRIGIQRRRGLQARQQRLAAADVGQQEALVRQPGPVDEVRAAAHGDVVAEPPRVLVGVGMTADPHDQRRVVDAIALGRRETQAVGDPRRDQRRPQHVLGRLPQPEVDGHRQRRQHLRACRKVWRRRSGGHVPILRCRHRRVSGIGQDGPPSRCRATSNASNRPCATTQMPRWGSWKSARLPCTGWGSDGAEVLAVYDGARVGDRPYASGRDAELLAVGQVAGQLDPADAQQRSDDRAHRGKRSAVPRHGRGYP